jgi:serine/threonine protein kinase
MKHTEKNQNAAKTEVYAMTKASSDIPLASLGQDEDVPPYRPVAKCLKLFNTYQVSCLMDYFRADGGVDGDDDTYFIVMSYTPGANLARMKIRTPITHELLPFPSDFVWFTAWSMAQALRLIHSRGVLHNDVKPDNIVYNHATGAMTLLDFGLACTVEMGVAGPGKLDQCDMLGGSPLYSPPEVFNTGKRSAAGDIWALAIVLWELATGQKYDIEGNFYVALAAISKGARPDLSRVPSNFYHREDFVLLLDHMLAFDPIDRPSAEQIIIILSDIFPTEELGQALHANSVNVMTALYAGEPDRKKRRKRRNLITDDDDDDDVRKTIIVDE